MNPSLREALRESHVAAVAIVVLLLSAMYWCVEGLWQPLYGGLTFVMTALAIRGIPWIPPALSFSNRITMFFTLLQMATGLVYFSGAWVLSRWVYALGPLRALARERATLRDESHV